MRHVLLKLDISQSEDSHRRVLAVLAHLSAAEAGTGTQPSPPIRRVRGL